MLDPTRPKELRRYQGLRVSLYLTVFGFIVFLSRVLQYLSLLASYELASSGIGCHLPILQTVSPLSSFAGPRNRLRAYAMMTNATFTMMPTQYG